jgi:antibiotic biosynthesis monooxygenase (ABM) superfamily enzyme
MSESTIRADSPVVTLINVFSVAPENQDRLLEAWQRSTDEVIRHLPGFVSANIHASLDGTKVINYAQWESQESFRSMLTDPAASEWLRKLAEIGTPAPVLCRVVSVHHAPE